MPRHPRGPAGGEHHAVSSRASESNFPGRAADVMRAVVSVDVIAALTVNGMQ